jgi:hypothetical protein
MMKLVAIALGALSILTATIPAKAACPAGTAYSCQQGYGGKVVCGCR